MQREIHNKDVVKLSLVVPVLNEGQAVRIFVDTINRVLANEEALVIEFIFINDGSSDNTLDELLAIQREDSRLKIVDLSRHFGKEAALTAGLYAATGDIAVPIDVDLQHPPELILEMLAKWREGYEVVLGRRMDRSLDSWGKQVSANLFYRIHNKISPVNLPENVGDFRLMDRCVVEALKELPESCRFMKGLFAWIGFRTAYVDYMVGERIAGTTKFNAWKLWNFALEGITSFSTIPLRIWTYLGFIISLLAITFAVSIVLKVVLQGVDVPGYASLIVAIMLFGGLQLIGVGVLGEYLGRVYIEAKRRPAYVVRHIYSRENMDGC